MAGPGLGTKGMKSLPLRKCLWKRERQARNKQEMKGGGEGGEGGGGRRENTGRKSSQVVMNSGEDWEA